MSQDFKDRAAEILNEYSARAYMLGWKRGNRNDDGGLGFLDALNQAHLKECRRQRAMYLSDLSKAVGILEGLGRPDKYLTNRRNEMMAEANQEKNNE